MPNPGRMAEWVLPLGTGIGVDAYVQPDATIAPFYDSMVAQVIVHAEDRSQALALMRRALERMRIEGVTTTAPLHQAILAQESFVSRPIIIRWLEESFLPQWESAS